MEVLRTQTDVIPFRQASFVILPARMQDRDAQTIHQDLTQHRQDALLYHKDYRFQLQKQQVV